MLSSASIDSKMPLNVGQMWIAAALVNDQWLWPTPVLDRSGASGEAESVAEAWMLRSMVTPASHKRRRPGVKKRAWLIGEAD